MKASRQVALCMALSLLTSGVALAASGTGIIKKPKNASAAKPAVSQPAAQQTLYTSQNQNLPPIQGYQNPASGYNAGYQPYGQSQYGQQPAYSQQPAQYAPAYQNPQAPLQGYVMTAPPGTVVSTTFTTPISSEFARVGDRFLVTLASPIAAGSSVLLPAGSQVEGQVVMVKAAGRTGRNGELEIRFTSATTPNGQRVPLSARIQTEDGTGIIKGGTTGGRVGRAALTTGVGAGLGAALGTAMGPLSGGGVGRGAIYGTVLGAGMGALGSAWQKGKPAVLETGQPVNIVLDQPLTTSPGSGGGGYNTYGQPQQQPQQDSNYQYYPQSGQQNYNNYYGGQ